MAGAETKCICCTVGQLFPPPRTELGAHLALATLALTCSKARIPAYQVVAHPSTTRVDFFFLACMILHSPRVFFFFFFFFFPPWQSFFLTLEAKGWDRFLMIGAARVKQRLRGYSKALLSSRTPNGTEDEIFFIVFVSLKYGSRAILPAAAIRAFVLVGGSLDGGASLLATVCTIHALPDCLCLPSQTCFVLVLPCMHHPIFQDQDHFCPK